MMVFIQIWEKKEWKKELSHRINPINHVKLTNDISLWTDFFYLQYRKISNQLKILAIRIED